MRDSEKPVSLLQLLLLPLRFPCKLGLVHLEELGKLRIRQEVLPVVLINAIRQPGGRDLELRKREERPASPVTLLCRSFDLRACFRLTGGLRLRLRFGLGLRLGVGFGLGFGRGAGSELGLAHLPCEVQGRYREIRGDAGR